MTSPTLVRTFIAVDLSATVRAALVRLKADLAQVPSDIRWVRDEGLHVTMKFLGPVATDRLPDVRHALSQAGASRAAFTLRVCGLGAFPSLVRPRVLWVGVEGAPLVDLERAITEALVPLGFPRELRPFHPHITLGRINGRHGWNVVHDLVRQHQNDDFGVSPVEALTTYRSDLGRGGARYSVLWTTALADSTRGIDYGT